jgi:hypothetical protein
MHHCKKFFIALQELFAAMQQKTQNTYFFNKKHMLRRSSDADRRLIFVSFLGE